jgi:hypothetical protein
VLNTGSQAAATLASLSMATLLACRLWLVVTPSQPFLTNGACDAPLISACCAVSMCALMLLLIILIVFSKCSHGQTVFMQELEVADQSFCEPPAADIQSNLDIPLLPRFSKVGRRYEHLFGVNNDTFGVER